MDSAGPTTVSGTKPLALHPCNTCRTCRKEAATGMVPGFGVRPGTETARGRWPNARPAHAPCERRRSGGAGWLAGPKMSFALPPPPAPDLTLPCRASSPDRNPKKVGRPAPMARTKPADSGTSLRVQCCQRWVGEGVFGPGWGWLAPARKLAGARCRWKPGPGLERKAASQERGRRNPCTPPSLPPACRHLENGVEQVERAQLRVRVLPSLGPVQDLPHSAGSRGLVGCGGLVMRRRALSDPPAPVPHAAGVPLRRQRGRTWQRRADGLGPHPPRHARTGGDGHRAGRGDALLLLGHPLQALP